MVIWLFMVIMEIMYDNFIKHVKYGNFIMLHIPSVCALLLRTTIGERPTS